MRSWVRIPLAAPIWSVGYVCVCMVQFITFTIISAENTVGARQFSSEAGRAVRMRSYRFILRGRAVVAQQAHNLKVGGSSPPPATSTI